MAFRWRIRHKLILGLALVVGVIALLLAGTLYGLASYRGTMKSIESKLAELRAAEDFKLAVDELKSTADPGNGTPEELTRWQTAIRGAEQKLLDYQEKLDDTLAKKRARDKGFAEQIQVDALHGHFLELARAVKNWFRPVVDKLGQSPLDDPLVKAAIAKLLETAGALRDVIYKDMYTLSKEAHAHYRASLWTVLTISIAGVLLLSGLLRSFFGWVFYPIRDLEQGAGRVAQGDFEHRIDVHSGDEMEDLAAAFNDMTGRLREMYRDLARQVNERSRQLVRSERLVSVGFLAAGVAHEINNPLASIAFCSEALQARLSEMLGLSSLETGPEGTTRDQGPGTKDKAVVAKYLAMIQKEAFRCKEITGKLLDFSRPGERNRELTDLAETVQTVLEVVQHLDTSKGKQIVLEPAARVRAWMNAPEIKGVVLNLVVNALDSMDEGGTLRIALGQRDGMAELVFADTGCGMPPEVLENIFEPFYTRSRTGRGTGLGLSISHRIISQHGGEIEATSPGLNRGSTFTVRLPLQPAESVKEETFGHVAA